MTFCKLFITYVKIITFLDFMTIQSHIYKSKTSYFPEIVTFINEAYSLMALLFLKGIPKMADKIGMPVGLLKLNPIILSKNIYN